MSAVNETIRIVLVDDQQLMRIGLRTILETFEDFAVVGEASSGDEALQVLRAARADVVLMDIQMPGMDGIRATEKITALDDAPAVIVLTTFNRDDYLFDALRAGASGFLLKNSPTERIVDAIRTVSSGNSLLSPDVTRRVIMAATQSRQSPNSNNDASALDQLTDRERDVFNRLIRGDSNQEIADRLFIGEATVRTHVTALLAKLNLPNRVHAVIWAYEHGAVPPDTPLT
jgi:DNA-binding NarL/FixJ family response regulator